MTPTFTEKEFDEDFRRLYYAILDAKAAYQIWWLLINADERPKYGNVLQSYAYFFSPIIRAQLVCMLMALCKVYDKIHGKNLRKFIKMSEEASFIKAELISEIESQISNFIPIISKLHILRNNLYAHIQLDGEIAYKIADINPNNFRDIIECTTKIIDKIAVACNKGKLSFDFNNVPTAYRLLDVLKSNLEK